MQIKGPKGFAETIENEGQPGGAAVGVFLEYVEPFYTNLAQSAEQKATFTALTVTGLIHRLGFVGGLAPGVVLGQMSISETGHTDEYDARDHLPGGKYFKPDPPAQLKMPPMWLADP